MNSQKNYQQNNQPSTKQQFTAEHYDIAFDKFITRVKEFTEDLIKESDNEDF